MNSDDLVVNEYLDKRIINCLRNAGYTSFEEIKTLSLEDLRRIKGMGETSVQKTYLYISEILAYNNIRKFDPAISERISVIQNKADIICSELNKISRESNGISNEKINDLIRYGMEISLICSEML